MSHLKKVCKRCEIVISQCRCMSVHKEIIYDLCESCKRELTINSTTGTEIKYN